MVIGTLGLSAVFFPYIGIIGIGVDSFPVVILSVEVDKNEALILEHNGGDELKWNDLKVLIDGNKISSHDYGNDFFKVGDEHVIKNHCFPENHYTVKVIFKPSNVILLENVVYVI